MNKHERIRAALKGDDVDGVPSGFWLHFPQESHTGPAAIQAHLDFYRETDVDLLKVMNEHPYRISHVTSHDDWASWKPLPVKGTYLQQQVDLVKAVADRLSGEVPILATIHGTFISTFHASKLPEETIFTHNLATEHLRENPEAVRLGLEAISDSLIELALACLEAGADGIYYGAQGGEAHRFSEQTFLDYVKPFDLKVLNALRDKTDMLIVHVCKDKTQIPLYADYPGDAFNWATHDGDYPLLAGRELFGKSTLLGGLDDRSGVMVDGDAAQIAAAVTDIVSTVGRRSLILGSDCTLPTDIEYGRIRTAVEAARAA